MMTENINTKTPVADQIHAKLIAAFKADNADIKIDLKDDSHQHIGHAGHDARGESHFSLTVTSSLFKEMSQVARQRYIYKILAEEMRDRVHALSLKTLS